MAEGGSPWFAVLPKESWPQDPTAQKLILADFSQGVWGDRRQEIVFIGTEKLEENSMKKALDECLVEEEISAKIQDMAELEKIWEGKYGKKELGEKEGGDGWTLWN
jgi:hypothetical protein